MTPPGSGSEARGQSPAPAQLECLSLRGIPKGYTNGKDIPIIPGSRAQSCLKGLCDTHFSEMSHINES